MKVLNDLVKVTQPYPFGVLAFNCPHGCCFVF